MGHFPNALPKFTVETTKAESFDSVSDLVDLVNNQITKAFDKAINGKPVSQADIGHHSRIRDQLKIECVHLPHKNKVRMDVANKSSDVLYVDLNFSPSCDDLLNYFGFDFRNPPGVTLPGRWSGGDLPLESHRQASIFYHNSMMFIYSDLVGEMIVGHGLANMLESTPMKVDVGDKMQVAQWDKLTRLKINKSYVSSIEVKLCHEDGSQIDFPIGKTFVKLQFTKMF
jgi:hypothetical protein